MSARNFVGVFSQAFHSESSNDFQLCWTQREIAADCFFEGEMRAEGFPSDFGAGSKVEVHKPIVRNRSKCCEENDRKSCFQQQKASSNAGNETGGGKRSPAKQATVRDDVALRET